MMGFNHCALTLFASGNNASVWQAAGCLALFIPIVAATSVICGRLLRKWLRWVVFSWTLLSLDLMTFVVGGSPMRGSFTAEMLACAMISGQLGALVVWGILVEQKWGIPFLIALVVVTGTLAGWHTIFGSAGLAEGWFSLMMFQAFALAIMCGAMRRRGFRLAKMNNGDTASGPPSKPRWLQFKHRTGYWNQSPFVVAFEALLGMLMAIVLYTAIMLAVGTHAFDERLIICAVTTFLIGVAFSFASSFAPDLLGSRIWYMYQSQFLWMVWPRWWWLAWVLLTSGFLASTLWFLRELGFQMTRK
jgi:hypothetical protein